MKKLISTFLILLVLGSCHTADRNDTKESLAEIKSEINKGESMFTIDNYIKMINKNLETNSKKLTEKLTEIRSLNFYSQVELLNFSFFIDPTSFELSIVMFSMDNEANEVFYEGSDSSLFADSMDILVDIGYYQTTNDQWDDFLDFYEQNEEKITIAEQEIIKDWFVDCWKKANDQQLELPSYISFHDEYKAYDLKKNKWISEDEMWSH